jgi:hypothetical protein
MHALRTCIVVLALATWPAAAAAQVVEDGATLVDPGATIESTPTPEASPTTTPTSSPEPGATPTVAPPPSQRDFIQPGYGSAAQQSPGSKRSERRRACDDAQRPPTSRMLGSAGSVPGGGGAGWVPLVLAIAAGAALFAGVAYRSRKREGEDSRPGALEGVSTLVAICGGLAALAGQFVPGATIGDRVAREAAMVVRDVKPRITRAEYADKMRLSVDHLSETDLDEVGDVVWLEITLSGFEDDRLRLQYGSYDIDASETLLPGTDRRVRLTAPGSDRETIFLPVWIGFPSSKRFVAEFRLVDHQGEVQQMVATGPLKGSRYRYGCEDRRS